MVFWCYIIQKLIVIPQLSVCLKQQNKLLMLELGCTIDSDCKFMYECGAEGVCIHQDIFPPSLYTIVIYVATGLCASLCNVSGNSMGIFKMLILIIALNYDLDKATGLAQALVVGSALPNFFSIIFRRHSTIPTSLVNYRLLEIIIPCSLLGSVIGAIGQTLIPKIAQLILLVLIFSYFIYNFINKLKKLNRPPDLTQSLLSQNSVTIQQNTNDQANTSAVEPINNQVEQQAEYRKIIDYENSMHLKDILLTLGIFIVFEFISFLVQGKLPFYSVEKCTVFYPLGIAALVVIAVGYIYWLRIRFRKVFGTYRRYNITQEVELDQAKQFFSVALGALIAGLVQGILGMGCGTCIMLVLLTLNMDSTAASATSGYQILFTGSASLLEFYINKQVQLIESVWFLGVCCVVGGIATLFLFNFLKKFDQIKVNKLLIIIILILCVMSIFLTIPTVMGILQEDGWEGMTRIAFHC